MTISLDHIFICCELGGPEAEALQDIGLIEGTSNVHPGQGTANRRFFFHGEFIELLWVHDPEEANSGLTSPTRLWPRWMNRKNGVCPFGVAFGHLGSETPAPPFDVGTYRPTYLPANKEILFAQGTTLAEPELFYLAWLKSTELFGSAAPKSPERNAAPGVSIHRSTTWRVAVGAFFSS